MSRILAIGSANTDLIAIVERLPASGETVQGQRFLQAMGGKGANQAMAAHRMGASVKFVCCLGNDIYGQSTLDYYANEGLDVSRVIRTDDAGTGTAVILVNREGENCIVVTPGANSLLAPQHLDKVESEIASASMVLLQMEVPYETVRRAIELATRHKTRIMLNVAPATEIDLDMLRMADIIVVNETEIERLAGESIAAGGEEGLMDVLLSRGAKSVILTLGKKGSIYKDGKDVHRIPAFQVEAVDTTAAGDTFCGTVAAQLGKGLEMTQAIRFATAAAAICVTRMGAQPSIPKEVEVIDFLKSQPGPTYVLH